MGAPVRPHRPHMPKSASVTDRQTDEGWAIAYSHREREFTFAKKCLKINIVENRDYSSQIKLFRT